MPALLERFPRLVGVLWATAAFAEFKPVTPAGVTPSGPFSPGVLTRDFLYISGQGANDAVSALDKVRAVVSAAGLTMEHIVYVQIYLTGNPEEAVLDKLFKEHFPKAPPARSTIGVAALPGTPVAIGAVAIRDLARKKAVPFQGQATAPPFSAAVIAADRIYVSGFPGVEPATNKVPDDPAVQVRLALAGLESALKSAGASLAHMVFVNPYLTPDLQMNVMNDVYARHFEFGNTPARATIQVSALPGGAKIQFTGVAVVDLARRRAVRPKNMAPSPTASPCVFAGDALFCSAKSGFIPGPRSGIYAATVETQLRQTMRNLLDGLEEADLSFSNVVVTHAYLDDMRELPQFNGIYAEYLTAPFPAQTTVQQLPPANRTPSARGTYPTLEQISLVAER